MDYDSARDYLNAKPETIETTPFGDDVLVYKVRNKMFATLSVSKNELDAPFSGMPCVNLKCDPDKAVALRDMFPEVLPGYHMNKKHWNTVVLEGSIPEGEIDKLIDHSYGLVVKGMVMADRDFLEARYSTAELYANEPPE